MIIDYTEFVEHVILGFCSDSYKLENFCINYLDKSHIRKILDQLQSNNRELYTLITTKFVEVYLTNCVANNDCFDTLVEEALDDLSLEYLYKLLLSETKCCEYVSNFFKNNPFYILKNIPYLKRCLSDTLKECVGDDRDILFVIGNKATFLVSNKEFLLEFIHATIVEVSLESHNSSNVSDSYSLSIETRDNSITLTVNNITINLLMIDKDHSYIITNCYNVLKNKDGRSSIDGASIESIPYDVFILYCKYLCNYRIQPMASTEQSLENKRLLKNIGYLTCLKKRYGTPFVNFICHTFFVQDLVDMELASEINYLPEDSKIYNFLTKLYCFYEK